MPELKNGQRVALQRDSHELVQLGNQKGRQPLLRRNGVRCWAERSKETQQQNLFGSLQGATGCFPVSHSVPQARDDGAAGSKCNRSNAASERCDIRLGDVDFGVVKQHTGAVQRVRRGPLHRDGRVHPLRRTVTAVRQQERCCATTQ